MNTDFKLFAVGPVEMDEETLQLGGQRLPYFRTKEFSSITLEVSKLIKEFVGTAQDSEVVLLTASGTGSMEAAVMNTFTKNDNLLVIAGGSFGNRFVEICNIHSIPHTVIKLNQGESLKKEVLEQYKGKKYTGLLINAHETSTGVYYDLPMIGNFCREENLILVVDSISSFLADPYYMDKWNIGMTIISSQKAIALPPGLSIIVINKKAVEKINSNQVNSLYFDLKNYFKDMERGQTPFTPAVGIILQLHAKLNYIKEIGADTIIKKTEELAKDFRYRIKQLPFSIPSESLSNAVTPLKPREGVSAHKIFEHLKDNYNIFVCPNGGQLRDTLFRVGHMGNLTIEDNKILIEALHKMQKEGLI